MTKKYTKREVSRLLQCVKILGIYLQLFKCPKINEPELYVKELKSGYGYFINTGLNKQPHPQEIILFKNLSAAGHNFKLRTRIFPQKHRI